ncbi:MAG: helix-turn-helix domain-containing protein [Candidatus Margulisbacteria bacterium]|jgi:transcriptional regulator with XRE-family HTH domain|nr:helix-turn-helix domain-containing protein [Candidatus Margulisiibacteriota bacterium]
MGEDDLVKILSTNIKRQRNHFQWSQEKLAEEVGASVAFISGIETGRKWVSPQTLAKLARAFGLRSYELLKPDDVLPQDHFSLLSRYAEDSCTALNLLKAKYLAKLRPLKHNLKSRA